MTSQPPEKPKAPTGAPDEPVAERPEVRPLVEKAVPKPVPHGTVATGGHIPGGGATKPHDLDTPHKPGQGAPSTH